MMVNQMAQAAVQIAVNNQILDILRISQWDSVWHVKFDMSTRHPSGNTKSEIASRNVAEARHKVSQPKNLTEIANRVIADWEVEKLSTL